LQNETQDIIIVGGGPAGLSAAITARQRNMKTAVISNDGTKSGLYKAREIGNYPGVPNVTGSELLRKLTDHALDAGARLITGQVNTVLPAGGVFNVGYGSDILVSKSLVLATGVSQSSLYPGEEGLLGRGVSYCATCDGMLFRGKKVCVVGLTPEADDEAGYLGSIGCEVVILKTKNITINGEEKVTSVTADGETIECDGVFVLRQAIAPHLLLFGLEMESGHIRAGLSAETNIPGVFAAGDCSGTPYQIAKAAGQGQIAALSAAVYLERNDRKK